MAKTLKVIKINGRIEIPVELTEETFEDLFLEWIQKSKFEFAGCLEDSSKT